jgi:hypothetical protein
MLPSWPTSVIMGRRAAGGDRRVAAGHRFAPCSLQFISCSLQSNASKLQSNAPSAIERIARPAARAGTGDNAVRSLAQSPSQPERNSG